jgi:hypothetical protein
MQREPSSLSPSIPLMKASLGMEAPSALIRKTITLVGDSSYDFNNYKIYYDDPY